MEPRRTEHQFNQLLDVVCEVRSLVQNYGEDERVCGEEASTKIQSLLECNEVVSQHLQILPFVLTKGSRTNISIIPPYNMRKYLAGENSLQPTFNDMGDNGKDFPRGKE